MSIVVVGHAQVPGWIQSPPRRLIVINLCTYSQKGTPEQWFRGLDLNYLCNPCGWWVITGRRGRLPAVEAAKKLCRRTSGSDRFYVIIISCLLLSPWWDDVMALLRVSFNSSWDLEFKLLLARHNFSSFFRRRPHPPPLWHSMLNIRCLPDYQDWHEAV